MEPIDARALANYLLAKSEVEQLHLDNLKIQKLVYITHGWHLGLLDSPLIAQTVEAWPYGPVVPAVYYEFNRFGSKPIDGRAIYFDRSEGWRDYQATLPASNKMVVDRVWEFYKKFTGPQLIALTHEPGTPWAEVVGSRKPAEIRNLPIPDSVIQRYYKQLADKNRANLAQ